MKNFERKNSLMPNDTPKYVRCYDNGGKTCDRYTVTFTGRYSHKTNNSFWYLGMSENPFHPQGVGCFGDSRTQIDKPSYSHLGKKIKFSELPENCKKYVINVYKDLWELN